MKKSLSLLLCLSMLFTMLAGVFTTASAEEPVKLTIFIDHTWYPVETFSGIIPEAITAATGVVLEPIVAVDNKQLGVMIASGELPDLVYTQTMVDRMSDPEVSLSYEDLIAQYNVDWKIGEKQLGIAKGYSTDGKAYTVLNHYSEKKDWEGITGAAPMLGSLLYRGDLYKGIGSPELKSFDDLYNAFGKIKETYPDVTPLKLNTNWNTLVFRYLNGMGQLDFIQQADGSYIHYTEDPRYHDMLMWLNKCYREGFIIADDPYFVKGSTAIADDKYFASCGCTQNTLPSTNAILAAINPSYYCQELVPFEESSYLTSDLGWSGTFITKNCKNPEAAIKLMAWMFSPEAQKLTQMGREGIEYTMNETGLPQFSQEWKDAIAADQQNNKYNTWFYLGGSEIVEAISRCATTDQALVSDAYKIMVERFDNLPWVMAALPIGESDEKIILDKIKTLVTTYEAKVILAASEEEAKATFDEYMNNAKSTGIADLDAYMTTRIAEVMPLYK